jgi:hypothetical protein
MECNGSVVFTWAACCVLPTTACLPACRPSSLFSPLPSLLFKFAGATLHSAALVPIFGAWEPSGTPQTHTSVLLGTDLTLHPRVS